eukprot:2044641-Rhodomonas_salina.3
MLLENVKWARPGFNIQVARFKFTWLMPVAGSVTVVTSITVTEPPLVPRIPKTLGSSTSTSTSSSTTSSNSSRSHGLTSSIREPVSPTRVPGYPGNPKP